MSRPDHGQPADKNLVRLDRQLKTAKGVHAAFLVALGGSCLAFTGGTMSAIGGFALGEITETGAARTSLMPTPAVQRWMLNSGIVAGAGMGSLLLLGFAEAAAGDRRRRLTQQKFHMEFRIVQGMLQPPAPKT
jgi:hypothetical protein